MRISGNHSRTTGGALLIDKQIGIYIKDNQVIDNHFWKELIKMFAVIGRPFEIHCWNEETDEIALASLLGKQKLSDWKHGTIIEGVIDTNFIDMLCSTEKPLNTDITNKMTPFFSIFINNAFSSEHYGTEIHIYSEPADISKFNKLLEQMQDYAIIHEYTFKDN